MIRNLFKALVFFGMIVLVSTSLFAGGQDENGGTVSPSRVVDPNATGHLAKGYEITDYEIDWYVNLPWFAFNEGNEWGFDLVSRTIQEKTGAKINFIIPATDGMEQLSTMLAVGDLPDIITMDGWWSQDSRKLAYQMANEDYTWSLNELMDMHAPSMWDDIREDVFAWHAEKDGDTYVLQNYAYGKKDLAAGERLLPNGGLVIRKDLWEQIGSPEMSSPEQFLDACEKIRDEIGNYDGQPLIPIQLYEGVGNSILWLSQYFAVPYEDEDGNWVYDFTHENYKAALAFLNDAYRRGLISDANFSDNRDLVNEKIASGRSFAVLAAPQDFVTPFQNLYDLDSSAVYMPVVLKNYQGDDPVLQDIRGMGWLNTSISKDAKNPDRIIQLFEYLISDEGIIDTVFGQEGITYDWIENGTRIQMTEQYNQDQASNNVTQYGIGSLFLLDNYALRRKWEVPPSDPKTLATSDTFALKDGMEVYSYDFTANSLKIDPTDSRLQDMTELSARINDIRVQAVAEIVTASSPADFEARYAAAVAELKELGLEELIEFNAEAFQNAKDALGIERSWGVLN